jgi:hypothetical protein
MEVIREQEKGDEEGKEWKLGKPSLMEALMDDDLHPCQMFRTRILIGLEF